MNQRLSWNQKIPFLKNTYALRSLFIAYLIVIVIMSVILTIIFIADGDADQLVDFAGPMLGVYAFIFLLFLVSAWIAMGNKYALRYTINNKGFRITNTRDKVKDIRKMAIVAGVLSGNPGLTGAGLLARKDEIFIPWKGVDTLEVDMDQNKIIVKCSAWYQVALHYPPEKEKSIMKMIDKYVSKMEETV